MQLINKLCILKFAVIIFISNLSATDVYYQGDTQVTIKNDPYKLARELLFTKIGNLQSIQDIKQNKDYYSVIIEMHKKKLLKKYNGVTGAQAMFKLAAAIEALTAGISVICLPINADKSIFPLISSSLVGSFFYFLSIISKKEAEKMITKIKRDETILKELNSI